MKKIKQDEIREKLNNLSCGLVASTLDLTLFFIFHGINLSECSYRSPKIAGVAEKSIEEMLSCGITKETIKRAIWKATHQKLIRRAKTGKGLFEITKEGIDRLNSLIPAYKKERLWDKHLYLVTYDIPEKEEFKRKVLRESLKKIGCGMLQDSVWITPYNPLGVLEKLIRERNIQGSIIISDVGKDGSVGREDLDDLIARVYHLEEINEKYKNFIQELKKRSITKTQAHFQYLSILKDDPQLPFEILPYNWLGDKAYQYLIEEFPLNPSNLTPGQD